MLIESSSASKNCLIGSRKGKNSKEKKKRTKAIKRNLAEPDSGFNKFLKKLAI